ncbi:tr [Leptolyngbya sp. Heron Island J]|uniref:DUF4168 domain-containing protein n=1 Tax=Leptolyngbya sp. Heron Island J TaxID=1385935 RepID=UPI0003B96DE6|nr:DUF4168 domain-containing protein [Leptolyngbya sp. Heron Island J]ESA39067.1 tr [Leptolyngbya sp. Heron Island J]
MMLPRRSSNDSHPPIRWIVGTTVGLLASASLPLSTLWQSGYAQSFTEEEIGNYAAAILAIEEIRTDAYGNISDLLTIANEDVTRHDLRCVSADSLTQMPRTVRSPVRRLLVNYCNNAKDLIEESGLTVQLFNAITAAHREDEALTEQIQLEIARQQ